MQVLQNNERNESHLIMSKKFSFDTDFVFPLFPMSIVLPVLPKGILMKIAAGHL